MPRVIRAKVGFVTPTSPSTPHFGSFLPIVPKDGQLDFEGPQIMRKSIDDLKDTGAMVLGKRSSAATPSTPAWTSRQ